MFVFIPQAYACHRIEVRRTQKGKPSLIDEGFMYATDRMSDKIIYWQCTDRGCHRRAISVKNPDSTTTHIPHISSHRPLYDGAGIEVREREILVTPFC